MRKILTVIGVLVLSAGVTRAEQKRPAYKGPGLPDAEVAKVGGAWVYSGTGDLVSDVDGARVGPEMSGSPEVSLAPGRHTLLLRPYESIYRGTLFMLPDAVTFVARKGHRYQVGPYVFVNGEQQFLTQAIRSRRMLAFKGAAPMDDALRRELTSYREDSWGSVFVFHEINDAADGFCFPGHNGQEALKHWDKRVTSNPGRAEDLFHRGETYFNLGKRDLASADFTQTLAIDPRFVRALQLRARVHYLDGQGEAALKDLDAAKAINPDSEWTHNLRGHVLWQKGDLDGAVQAYGEAIAIQPSHVWAHHCRAQVLHTKGEYDKALADFAVAIESSPTFMPAWFARAQTWMAKREYDKAIADYSHALLLDVEYTNAYVMRGHAYTWKDEWDKAVADYSRAITLEPANAVPYDARAGALNQKKDYQGVVKDESKAIELGLKGSLALTYSRRANAHAMLGDDAAALADYSESFRLNPNDAATCGKLALLDEKKGDRGQALAMYLKAAELFVSQKQPGQAVGALSAALDLDPKQATAYARRGELYEGQNQVDKAIADYSAALKLAPQNADWRKRLQNLKPASPAKPVR